jgi:hypothetical protein
MRSISSRVFAPAARARVAAEWRGSWNRSPSTPAARVASSHVATIKRMTIQRLENVGIVVDDLASATTFFVELGLKRSWVLGCLSGWPVMVLGAA